MAPKKSNGKKKKVVSNRGFSTVSVPRKKDAEEDVATNGDADDAANSSLLLPGDTSTPNDSTLLLSSEFEGVSGPGGEEWDETALERHELQLLVERIKPVIEKDLARVMKGIDYEKRIAKGFSYYPWQEQDLVERVFELELKEESEEARRKDANLEDGLHVVVGKVGLLENVLEQLGFSKERIGECLLNVVRLDLDDVLDWLFLHCDASELNCLGPIEPPSSPEPERQPTANNVESAPPSPFIVASPNPGSSTPAKIERRDPSEDVEREDAAVRARVLAYENVAEESSTEEGNDLDDEYSMSTNQKWAKLRLEESELVRVKAAIKKETRRKMGAMGKAALLEDGGSSLSKEGADTDRKLEMIKKKMKEVEGEYSYIKSDAEKLYREERVRLDANQLSERLNSTALDETPSSALLPSPPITSNGTPNGDSTQASDGPSFSRPSTPDLSFFGALLDEQPGSPSNPLDNQSTTINVLDLSLPKHFSGKTPKVLLEETVRKIDKYAAVFFKVPLPLSTSNAVRAGVEISWDGKRREWFEMKDLACRDKNQAMGYISTVALFEIARAGGNKLLPAIFRDVWDELEKKKVEEEEAQWREKVISWKEIVEARKAGAEGKDHKATKGGTTAPETIFNKPSEVTPEMSERIIQELSLRQQWPSYQEMLQHRATLPIAAYRSFIMSTIESSQCVVLCGETGCGKSTQVPSFILEHDMRRGRPVKIYCTEPRRISAISLAQRVSIELGEAPGACGGRNSFVGYSIRLDARVSQSSKIIYATTGIVLRMLEGLEALADCTHLVLDEVHERSIDSDFLLIVLREILEVRKDLKVILMSATVDAEKISAYMGGCPVINVPGRTFPVTAVYLEEVLELTRYHLDPASDSQYVARRMRTYGGRSKKAEVDDIPPNEDDEPDILAGQAVSSATSTLSKQTRITLECMDHHAINFDLIVTLLENVCFYKPELQSFSAATLIFLPSLESIRRLSDILEGHQAFGSNHFLVLPLHSTISNENQGIVFNVPPPGVRKIIISTNLAETGVTIPDITCVIDTGMHREMRFDEKRQISRLVQTFVAQSNAAQRRGRAGRVQEGICFHLFTKQRHDMFAEHPQPEMMRLSLQDLALRIKIMKIGDSVEDVLLKALDPPLAVNVQRAVSSLIEAKALTTTEEITPLGRHLAKLPMDVHLGKFLIMSCLFNCLDAALTITAALNSKSPWLTPFGRESEADTVKRSFKVESSDFLTLYNAYCCWRDASANGYEREFTRKSFLSQQNLVMIEDLRQQYFSFLVDAGFIQISEGDKRDLLHTRHGKSRTRFVRVPAELDTYSRDPKAVMACLAGSMYPKLLVVDPQSGQMRTLSNNAPAAIHPSSVNFAVGRRIEFGNAKFIVFFTAMHTKKLYVWESGSVDERAVYLLCGNSDIELPAHSLSIDRKIRIQLEPKTVMAMKVLRSRFAQLFVAKMRNPGVTTESQQQWMDLVKEALVSKRADDEITKATPADKVTVTLHRMA